MTIITYVSQDFQDKIDIPLSHNQVSDVKKLPQEYLGHSGKPVISSISAEQLRLEMRSPSKNANEKITTETPSVLARTGATVPLALSRPNEKYGAVAASADSSSRPLSSTFSRFELDRGMIYLSVLIGDMTRGILFPTVNTISDVQYHCNRAIIDF